MLRVACVQLASGHDVDANLEQAEQEIRRAGRRGARLIVLPEKWNAIGDAAVLRAAAEPRDGRSTQLIASLARDLDAWILAGSIVVRSDNPDGLLRNVSMLVAPDGRIAATYAKLHLFDVDLAGVSYRESDAEQPGDDVVVAEVDGVQLGMSICYDLRFPELYRMLTLAGARLLAVPAAFTLHTGRDHWEVLLRARAVENQCFVLAPNIIGSHGAGKVSYGRSMIVDPWGTVLACAPDSTGVIVVDLDLDAVDRVRAAIPALDHRRGDIYGFESERTPSST